MFLNLNLLINNSMLTLINTLHIHVYFHNYILYLGWLALTSASNKAFNNLFHLGQWFFNSLEIHAPAVIE